MPSRSNEEPGAEIISLLAEEADVVRRHVVGDTLRITTVTREHKQEVDEMLTHQRIEVERVPIGRTVDIALPVRVDGNDSVAWTIWQPQCGHLVSSFTGGGRTPDARVRASGSVH